MRSKLTDFCSAIQFMSCDSEESHFVDYSKSTNKQRGAELNCESTDLPGLLIRNSHENVIITAAIFDDHCFKKADAANEDEEHCEGVVFPEPYTENSWNLFVELKYDNKLGGKPKKAYEQIVKTVRQLREAFILPDAKKVYGVVYFPMTGSKPPYSSSTFSIEEFRRLKREENLILSSSKALTVVSPSKLRFS